MFRTNVFYVCMYVCMGHIITHIFSDNFFTSVKLFQELHEVRVYATGTLRADRRGFQDDLKGCVIKGFKERGMCNIRRNRINTNLSVCVWQDTKVVTAVPLFAKLIHCQRYKEK